MLRECACLSVAIGALGERAGSTDGEDHMMCNVCISNVSLYSFAALWRRFLAVTSNVQNLESLSWITDGGKIGNCTSVEVDTLENKIPQLDCELTLGMQFYTNRYRIPVSGWFTH